jgi:hypothetical protein
MEYSNRFEEMKHWVPVSDLKFLPSSHVFVHFEAGHYVWRSTIALARLLRRTVPKFLGPHIFPTEAMRTKEVDVLWTCLVDPAEFSDPNVENYKENLLKDLLVDADFSTRTAHGFPLIPGIDDIG